MIILQNNNTEHKIMNYDDKKISAKKIYDSLEFKINTEYKLEDTKEEDKIFMDVYNIYAQIIDIINEQVENHNKEVSKS